MNAGGDAAEQVVRMSLEGVEVAARISGEGAKQLAILIAAVLKEEQKTHGKARLSNMIKSGNELKVFTVQQKDLKTFAREAKRYGVLYSILREKGNKNPDAAIDKFHDDIVRQLEDKHRKVYNHLLYTTSKTAKSEEEREEARQKYLDEVGMKDSYRY